MEGKMKAEVVIVNYIDKRFAALTDDSEYIILTLTNGYDIDLGDLISGNYINPVSSNSYYNHSQNQAFKADFNNVCLNFKQALDLCTHLKN